MKDIYMYVFEGGSIVYSRVAPTEEDFKEYKDGELFEIVNISNGTVWNSEEFEPVSNLLEE